MLVLTVAENLNKLLQNGCTTTIASLGELGRIVVVTIDLPFVFVVAVLRAKNCWANGTGEMFDVVLLVQGCDI